MIAVHLLYGPLMLLIGWLYKKFPPKKINSFMGYRTYRSMKNQETWDYANKKAASGLVSVGIATSFVQIILLSFSHEPVPTMGATIFMSAALFFMIFGVERALKREFE